MLQLISWELCILIFIIPACSSEEHANMKWLAVLLAALFAYLTFEQGAAFTGINF